MPPQPGEEPWVGNHWIAQVGLAFQQTDYPGGARDFSAISPFRLSYPFAGRVALIVEGTPLEAWVVSWQTQDAWRPRRWNGLTKGDIRIGAKFLLYGGRGWIPGVALRALTRTTTGKDVEDRRFMNAPGYLFDLVFGERWSLSPEVGLEAWLSAGFLAWQQAGFGQNDAFNWSATTLLHLPRASVRLEARGYQGWEQYDKPLVLMAGLELPISSNFQFLLTTQRTLRDPEVFDVRVGLRFRGSTEVDKKDASP
ncbi:hypothetical protein JQX13_42135 [Archangium violaceum]|uniref:hypothetical protein n=1 Tax=Archangium violaceum TaxID=83451 RepID=UPI00193B11B0|nr:hypothetical protein [Archangium violaceum]QRK06618.1 hypothetical protein JQX13_42135 [Archangium violaceum]